MKLELQDRSLVERTILGALKNAIDSHGPIATAADRSSAAKRVYGVLKSLARKQEAVMSAELSASGMVACGEFVLELLAARDRRREEDSKKVAEALTGELAQIAERTIRVRPRECPEAREPDEGGAEEKPPQVKEAIMADGDMPAGRGFDARVWLALAGKPPESLLTARYVDGDIQPHAGYPMGHISPPHYSTDIAHALEVLEYIVDQYDCIFSVAKIPPVYQLNSVRKYRARLSSGKIAYHSPHLEHVLWAETMPLAICRAALYAAENAVVGEA